MLHVWLICFHSYAKRLSIMFLYVTCMVNLFSQLRKAVVDHVSVCYMYLICFHSYAKRLSIMFLYVTSMVNLFSQLRKAVVDHVSVCYMYG